MTPAWSLVSVALPVAASILMMLCMKRKAKRKVHFQSQSDRPSGFHQYPFDQSESESGESEDSNDKYAEWEVEELKSQEGRF